MEMLHLDFMMHAVVVSVIFGIVLAYLGVHVVGRGIVFVDLALGQISSLGVAFSDYIGFGKTIIPIAFTLTGALLMSMINIRDKRLKLEAIIGIIYAVASAVTVMLISKTPHGDSDIQEVLFGNILSVDLSQIKIAAGVFAFIAIIHILFYKKFFALTQTFSNHENHINHNQENQKNQINHVFNFIFYLTIGLAIVFAVRTSGVIPVFSFLIIPAVAALMLSKSNKGVVTFAILISVIAAWLGLDVSYHFDFPAGASLVVVLGGLFLMVSVFYLIKSRLKKV